MRVGIDGPDASGKTFFADGLAATLRERGRPVVRVSVDDFHHVRAVRYRLGRASPEGFWLHAFDYGRLRTDVLDPLAPGGSRRYRPRAHDLATDAVLHPEPIIAPPGAVVIVDGLFLHRDELRAAFDLTVFLDVPFEVTAQRLAHRDGIVGPDLHRYVEAQRIYFAACAPRARATILIDNTDPAIPRLIRP
ncbi:uridine kinase [Virgisporangium aurantiacum]|uniref:uridine kinase n=1 Tax=Virgisporangium aurantiacum TaxID=175570 RepID=UPI001EF1C92E|nr:uridine kinase [Virgisporangium aurantiacum]